MRRVVVTGLGIVSSIGNNADEVTDSLRHARSGIVTADDYVRLGFRSQIHGSLKIDLDAVVDRRARRFQGDGAGYCWVAMNQAIADAGLTDKGHFQSPHRLDRGFGRAFDQGDRRRRRYGTRSGQGAQAHRAVRGAQGDVVHLQRQSIDLVQDQGRELFDLLGLFHLGQLHRQRGGDDPMGQAGHDVRRRRRGTGLDAERIVRRDGCDVVQIQCHAR